MLYQLLDSLFLPKVQEGLNLFGKKKKKKKMKDHQDHRDQLGRQERLVLLLLPM